MTDTKTPDYFFYIDDEIYFRPLRASDLDGRWSQWFNDPEVTEYQSMGIYPNTLEAQRRYFDGLANDRSNVVLAIVDRKTDAHVGNVGLHRIDPVHRAGMLGIVVGEKSAWGRRIGARSWAAITRYGFEILNLNKISATIVEGNEKSMKCALAAGFVVEGTQVQQLYKNGKYRDLVHVGLVRANWKG